MPKSILVPIDGSTLAKKALPFASWLHRSVGARITLLRALPTLNRMFVTNASALRIAQERQEVEARQAETETRGVAETLTKDGVDVGVRMRPGAPAAIILEEAATQKPDLIIMFTHGRSATERFLFGSVADEVILHGDVPIMVISPNCLDEWPAGSSSGHVLLTLDGSEVAEAAIPAALDLARALSADVVLLRVEHSGTPSHADDASSYLDSVATRLRSEGATVSSRALTGAPAETILRMAREEGTQAIAMATHGRGGIARAIAGSVTTAVVREATVPVMVYRPPAMRAPREDQGVAPSSV
jgi:nucleotide-binding universal stress UspA family protein